MTQLSRVLVAATLLLLGLLPGSALAQPADSEEIGVTERLGAQLNLDAQLVDESGKSVTLRDVVDRPTLLVFVYLSCPGICDPLLREIARNLDQLALQGGRDYRVVTISFDPNDTPDVAHTKQSEILGTMQHPLSVADWRFLTGKPAVVQKLTDAAGFKYKFDAASGAYVHASSLIFLSREGKVVRYLSGIEFLPAHLKLAFHDAAEGRQRSFMRSLERLCYAYDPKGRSYVLQVNRLILGATGVFVLGFAGIFLRRKKKAKPAESGHE